MPTLQREKANGSFGDFWNFDCFFTFRLQVLRRVGKRVGDSVVLFE